MATQKYRLKLFISFLTAFALIGSLAACGGSSDRKGKISLNRNKKDLADPNKKKTDPTLTPAQKKAKEEAAKKAKAVPAMTDFDSLLKASELETAVVRALKNENAVRLNKLKEGKYTLSRVINEVVPEKGDYTYVVDTLIDTALDESRTTFSPTDAGTDQSVSWEKKALKGNSVSSLTNIPLMLIVNDKGEVESKIPASFFTEKKENVKIELELAVVDGSTHEFTEILSNIKSSQDRNSSETESKFGIDIQGDSEKTHIAYKVAFAEPKDSTLLMHIEKTVTKKVEESGKKVDKSQVEQLVLIYSKK